MNGLTIANLAINATNCYCDPTTQSARTCNCCVSQSQYSTGRPVCPAARELTQCKCDLVANSSSLSCACPNRFFFNQTTSAIRLSSSNCQCARTNSTTNLDCQCCATQQDVIPTLTCQASEVQASCDRCRFNATRGQV